MMMIMIIIIIINNMHRYATLAAKRRSTVWPSTPYNSYNLLVAEDVAGSWEDVAGSCEDVTGSWEDAAGSCEDVAGS